MRILHTKGPWSSQMPIPEPYLVRDGAREWLTFEWQILGTGGQLIGNVEFNTSDRGLPHVSRFKEAEANMRLVVAAPDLLDALVRVVAISDRKHDAWDAAKAAIAKTRGAA